MLPDVASLLTPGAIVDRAGPLAESADRLVTEGLARASRRNIVRCANPDDFDFIDAVDPSCPGRVTVPEGDLDDWVWCPRCERRLETSRKQAFEAMVLQPDLPALRARVEQMLRSLGMLVREQPEGVFRIESDGKEAAVVLMDACGFAVRTQLTVEQGAIAVAADCSKFGWQLPPGAPLLAAAELVLLSPDPLLTALRAALAGAPRVIVVAPPQARTAPSPAPRFQLPPGARWNDVTIYYVDGATVGIAVPGARPVHASAIELGMAKETSRTPSRRFALLLHVCRHRGRTDWKTAGFAEDEPIAFDNFAAFRMQVSPLRRDLQRLFGLAADPFAPLGRSRPLVAAFRALPEAPGELAFLPRAG
jgi:hypothetical protein